MLLADIATQCGYDVCPPLPETGFPVIDVVIFALVLLWLGAFLLVIAAVSDE